jgi:PEP-CTERM motif-containing protein
MCTSTKWILALALMALWSGAQAQTYDVVESFGTLAGSGFGPYQLSFTGSFTINPHGTGLCSALLCGPGVIPDFTNVNMSGTSASPYPNAWGPNIPGQMALTEGVSGPNTLTFYNSNGFPFGSTEDSELTFTLDSPLGSATRIGTSDAYYSFFGGKSVEHGVVVCGLTSTCSGRVTVPEPTMLSLFALGLAGIGFMRRRKSAGI